MSISHRHCLPAGLFAAILALLAPVSANADAGSGELFGFILGEVYEPESTAQRTEAGEYWIVALSPDKTDVPSNIETVNLFLSKETFTIVRIRGFTEFPPGNHQAAKTFAAKYSEILRRLYPDWELSPNNDADSTQTIFSPTYMLTTVLQEFRKEGLTHAGIELAFNSSSPTGKVWKERLRIEAEVSTLNDKDLTGL